MVEEGKHQPENRRYLKMKQDSDNEGGARSNRSEERADHPNTSPTQRQKKHECVRGKTKATEIVNIQSF